MLSSFGFEFISKGYLAVDLFFSLSGFVMMLSSAKYFTDSVNSKSYLTFMLKRFARVYPVYLVIITIVFFYQRFSPLKTYFVSLPLMSAVFNKGHIIPAVWSLSAEWVIYLIFPFIALALNKYCSGSRNIITALAGVVILILFRFDLNILDLSYHPFNGLQPIMRCLGNYILGIYAYQMVTSKAINKQPIKILTSITAIGIIVLLFCNVPHAFFSLLFPIFIGLLYLDTGVVSRFLSSKIVYFLGLISYSLYLIHQFVLRFKGNALNILGHTHLNQTNKLLAFNIMFIVTIVTLANLFYNFIEIPSQKYLKRRFQL
ncbi:acyltransferase family protein [Mucilaginibacter lacusdianchii]|uniref:acyltransferase family protein n=1 Tax=Mucilaginibacter lacusdianchii TaxID=2684211 RepID=UPI00131AF671|nr:acyltransferase [Mucilaginibacter sp. JXJ CY 39]